MLKMVLLATADGAADRFVLVGVDPLCLSRAFSTSGFGSHIRSIGSVKTISLVVPSPVLCSPAFTSDCRLLRLARTVLEYL